MLEKRSTFFIKKNSTLPILKFPINEWIMEEYDITEDMFENCAITFSMYDVEDECYRIANKAASLLIQDDLDAYPSNDRYILTYNFLLSETIKPGIYEGEFKVDFLGENCGKITFPINNKIKIVINNSITKTTVESQPSNTPTNNIFDYTLDFNF
jgi:hypothetical protein